VFLARATEKGHNRGKLEKLWQSFEGFADYAFNRAHSFSYGYLAYQTAYLKAYWPTHFWAAVLSNELNNTEKIVKYINEAKAQSIEILPPDVNVSLDNFTASGNSIRFGLAAIKGIGQSVVASVVEARAAGPFKSIFDFAERVDSRALNKRALESLIRAGAFDTLGAHRAQAFAAIDRAIETGQSAQRTRETGQFGLFSGLGDGLEAIAEPPLPAVPEWGHHELLRGEKETLGFYISGHPLTKYEAALQGFASVDVDRLSLCSHGDQVTLGGIVRELSVRTTKKGDKFGLFQLEDKYGSVKVVAWPDMFGKLGGKLADEQAVLVHGRLEIDDGGAMAIIADEISALDNIRERNARTVVIHLLGETVDQQKLERLHKVLDSHHGECNVVFSIRLERGSVVRVRPNQFVRVRVTPELTTAIHQAVGDCRVELLSERDRAAVA
jgi:DNA polymerase-3 subunit alpha